MERKERISVEEKIISILKNNPLKTQDIAEKIGIDRHTAVKYLESMESRGLISHVSKRRAKIWGITDSPVIDMLKRKDIIGRQFGEILDSVDEHISIQDRTLEVIWRNEHAKSRKLSKDALKCHEAYFDQNHRCRNCPVERTFITGKPEMMEIKSKNIIRRIITKPIKDNNDATIAVVEIIKERPV
jgi:Mn-dependent DtxR family transcriptional regulator